MLIFRPVNFADLPQIEHLAVIAGNSMTTLPNNRDHLAELINSTKNSLANLSPEPSSQSYHFVIENNQSKDILGISGIEACVGSKTPFYSYYCDNVEHKSDQLQIQNTVSTLRLTQDYDGASRLCTFYLSADNQCAYALLLLSLSRLMFIGQHPQRFSQKLMFELQGIVDENRQSPFWLALGQHFFSMDFQKANYLTGINAKSFIADLMPKHPIYVPLLDSQAQSVIGVQRPDIDVIRALLSAEGFSSKGYISIFDAGPTLEAQTTEIKTINQQFKTTLQVDDNPIEGELQSVLISNNSLQDYRCIYTSLALPTFKRGLQGKLSLAANIAKELKVSQGDTLYVLPVSEEQLAMHNLGSTVATKPKPKPKPKRRKVRKVSN